MAVDNLFTTVVAIQGRHVNQAQPGTNQALAWDGTQWIGMGPYLPTAGGTVSGNLTVGGTAIFNTSNVAIVGPAGAWPGLSLVKSSGGSFGNAVLGCTGVNGGAGVRWQVYVGDQTPEGTGNSGSDFHLESYDNNGSYLRNPLFISRATGNATFSSAVSLQTGQALYLNGTTGGTAGRIACDANNFYLGLPGSGVFVVGNAASTTNLLTIDANGNFTISGSNAQKASGTTWSNPSSRDIKEDIKNYEKGLQAILGLRPVTYKFRKDSGLPTDGTHIGLVFDETGGMPEMHTTAMIGDREVAALDCSAVTWALVNAIKELKAEIDAIKEARHGSQEPKHDGGGPSNTSGSHVNPSGRPGSRVQRR